MPKKIIAIIGSYRKSGVIDQAVDAALKPAVANGAEAEKVYLTDKHIEFCTNCRACTQESPDKIRGKCVISDDMNGILDKIDSSDAIILASPVNFSTVTALMKKFVERLIVYGYWPWSGKFPVNRVKARNKKCVIITASGCPVILNRLLMPSALNIMKMSAGLVGARVVKSLYFGSAGISRSPKLTAAQNKAAGSSGNLL